MKRLSRGLVLGLPWGLLCGLLLGFLPSKVAAESAVGPRFKLKAKPKLKPPQACEVGPQTLQAPKSSASDLRARSKARKKSCAPTTQDAKKTQEAKKKPLEGGWFRASYLIDWGIAVGLGAGALGFFLSPAVERPHRIAGQIELSIQHKMRPDTVPIWLAAVLAGGLPLAGFGLAQIGVRSGHDFHHATLGLFETLGLTFFLTEMLKTTVGRLRPDFLDRCKPSLTDPDRCTGDASVILDGRKSFVSGHSSFMFAGMSYLSLYLMGKLKPWDGQAWFWKIPILLAPLGLATWVAVTRTADYRHHWEDVTAGALLGIAAALLCYHLNFPSPFTSGSASDRPLHRVTWQAVPLLGPQQIGLAVAGSFL